MDLRKYIKTEENLQKAIKFIADGTLFYQPFIIHDNIIVGEARNFIKQYSDVNSIYDYNLYVKGFPELENINGVKRNTISEEEKDFFIKINNEYDYLYDFFINEIIKELDEPLENLSFAEIGSNTGIALLKLCEKGAKECYAYDWNNYEKLFSWYKKLLNKNINFRQCGWDNLYHRILIKDENKINIEKTKSFIKNIFRKEKIMKLSNHYAFESLFYRRDKNLKTYDVPQVDVMLNTVFTNHQFDPLQFIAYCCDRSKKLVFFWALIDESSDNCSLRFPESSPHEEVISAEGRDFPINYNNDVRFSEKLFYNILSHCGFGEVKKIIPEVSEDFGNWGVGYHDNEKEGSWRLFIGKRTSEKRSAFYKNKI